MTRRQFLAASGAFTFLSGSSLIRPTRATAAPATSVRRRGRPDVAVLGAGVAGLTAAHELAERGFRVTVVERNGLAGLGGKARSIPVPGTARAGRLDLPGEHGFRIFFGFYQHLTETMRRIPFGANPNGVWDNLVGTSQGWAARDAGRRPFVVPYGRATVPTLTPLVLEQILLGLVDTGTRIPPNENAYFARKLVMYMTTSQERRLGELEYTRWSDYLRGDTKSEDYRDTWVDLFTADAQAVRAHDASTRSTGLWFEQFVYNILGLHAYDGSPIRVLDAPTDEAFVTPWVNLLRTLGVTFVTAHVSDLDMADGAIRSASVVDDAGTTRSLAADWFVCALPFERAVQLWNSDILAADPGLGRMANLRNGWMVGHQLFMRSRVDLNRGHIAMANSPWRLVCVQQTQFWNRDVPAQYGDGAVNGILSTCISDWETPGIVFGKPAAACTRDEIATEVWAQVKEHMQGARIRLTDDMIHSSFLDPAITLRGSVAASTNESPLFLNTVGCLDSRPTSETQIPNLFLASDYVRTNMDVACMESASEAARRAVNALLERAASTADRAATFEQFDPPEFRTLKAIDAARYRQGQPHVLDTGEPLVDNLFDLQPLRM